MRYVEFFSIYFTIIIGVKKIVCYAEVLVISRFVIIEVPMYAVLKISEFVCTRPIILALNRFLPHFERVVVLKSKEAGSFSVHCMELRASVKYIIGYVLELYFRHAKDTFCTHFCEP